MPTNYQVANAALDVLSKKSVGVNTRALLTMSGMAAEGVTHLDFRNVLNRLHRSGVVSRTGEGKFYWSMIVTDWDRNNPFKPQKGGSDEYTKPKEMSDKDKAPAWYKGGVPWKYLSESERQALLAAHLDSILKKDDESSESSPLVTEAYKNEIKSLKTKVEGLEEDNSKLHAQLKETKLKSAHVKVLEIKQYKKPTVKLKDKVLPAVYEQVLQLAGCRRNILLVGPAGCGKSYLAKLVADSLGLTFGSLSCTAGMSESHLLGRAVPDLRHGKNKFQGTQFLKLYEGGGLFLLDELDAGDANLLLSINTALANGYCNVPNRIESPRAEQHDDFVLIATANTFGRGATRQYAGRNQLDEATIDRFRIGIVECDYDEAIEKVVCPDDDLRQTCQEIRKKIGETGLRRIMSTRFIGDAYIMKLKADWTKQQIMDAFFTGWTPEEKAKVA